MRKPGRRTGNKTETRYKAIKRKIKILYLLAVWGAMVVFLVQFLSKY